MLREAQHAALLSVRPVPQAQRLHRPQHVRLRALHQRHVSLRGVVLIPHTGRKGLLVRPQGPQNAAGQLHVLMQHVRDHLPGNSAGPQDRRLPVSQVQHRGFKSHLAGPPVQDQGNSPLHILQHVSGRRGRRPSGPVGAGRGDGQAAAFQQLFRAVHGGHPHRHRGQPRGHLVRHLLRPVKQHRQRPRPEGVHQLLGSFRNPAQALQLILVPYVNDQRVIRRPPLGRENGEHGLPVQGVGPQSVNRLRGEANQLSL